ncbi:MAG: twin-arginine translocase TatA/TatE family subunit [Bacteroidaceae bacterium]|nr:twin-arginine translocase TatA/TatE family subunit [Bacteroidaceae bacterium]
MVHHLLFFGNLGGPEIILIALVILLLYGGKKIPELMHGVGKGVRSFKEGMNDIQKQIEEPLEEKKEISDKQ